MRNDFDIPGDLCPRAEKAAEAIVRLLGPDASGGGCRAFYSPEEWRERGETYGRKSLLVLVHDGGDLARHCNYDYGDYKAVERLAETLKPFDLYVEACTSWYSAVYPIY